MGQIFSRIQRPPAELVQRFARLGVPRVAACSPEPLLADSAIKPLFSRALSFCGPAVTVRSDRADLVMGVLATGVAQAGDVIVVSTGGDHENACWGGGLTLSADNIGCAAVALDGLVEDSAAIAKRKTPVFCRGSTMRKWPTQGTGSVNVEILFGGVPVRPGDLVVGDSDGVCVIPQERLASLIDVAEAMDAETLGKIAATEAAKAVLFDNWGGRALVERLGMDWVD